MLTFDEKLVNLEKIQAALLLKTEEGGLEALSLIDTIEAGHTEPGSFRFSLADRYTILTLAYLYTNDLVQSKINLDNLVTQVPMENCYCNMSWTRAFFDYIYTFSTDDESWFNTELDVYKSFLLTHYHTDSRNTQNYNKIFDLLDNIFSARRSIRLNTTVSTENLNALKTYAQTAMTQGLVDIPDGFGFRAGEAVRLVREIEPGACANLQCFDVMTLMERNNVGILPLSVREQAAEEE